MTLIPYKKIGDTLTTDEYNGIISLIRHNKILSEDLTIKNGTITTDYGKYTFQLESTTILDNGILITDETLTNLGTVTLTQPVFSNATYTLLLTVYTMEDANIMADETISNIEETTLEIELEKDVAVNIPFETLAYSCIVSFDAKLSIKQDKPVIQGDYVTGLNLSANNLTIQSGETSILTMKATDLETMGVPNKSVKLYKNTAIVDTFTTDNNGECTYNYTGNGTGIMQFQAKHLGTITSDTITIYDCIFHDKGTLSNYNDDWTNYNNKLNVTRDDAGTTLTPTSADNYGRYIIKSDYIPNAPFVVEFDKLTTTSNANQIFFLGGTINLYNAFNGDLRDACHLKFEVDLDGKITTFVDGVEEETQLNYSSSAIRFQFQNTNQNAEPLKYANFKIYPI